MVGYVASLLHELRIKSLVVDSILLLSQLAANTPGKPVEDSPKLNPLACKWQTRMQLRFWPGTVPVIVAIWGVNRQMKFLSHAHIHVSAFTLI